MKKLVSLLMVLAMLLSCTCTAMAETATTEGEWHDRWLPTYVYSGETKLPDYMNTESYFPIVKEDADITLKIGLVYNDTYCTPEKIENMWFYKFLTEYTNIKFEFECIPSSALSQRKSLVFLEELPDIMMGYGLTTTELVTYGDVDGQLLNMVPYITPDIAPSITLQMQDEEIKMAVTTGTGAIYTLPRVYGDLDTNNGNTDNMYIQSAWLEEIGLDKVPATLKDFTAMLYAFKEKHPEATPLLASDNGMDVRTYVLSALGYLTSYENDTGAGPGLRNGEVVIPAYTETFKEFLKVMNEWYVNGLIPQDYFALDTAAENALVEEMNWGATARYSPAQVITDIEKCQKLISGTVLTSDWNDTPQMQSYSHASKIGGVAVSAATKYPEVCVRLLDFWFTELGNIYQWEGPATGSPDTMGMTLGTTVDPEWKVTYAELTAGNVANAYEYVYSTTNATGQVFGHRASSLYNDRTHYREISIELSGYEATPFTLREDNTDNWFKLQKIEGIFPYLVTGYPTYVYLDEETSMELADLKSVIDPYIETEVAKFITGQNSLDNFDKFQQDLKTMGIEDMLKIYTDAYAPYAK